jgi:Flp pilus assembly protein TadG
MASLVWIMLLFWPMRAVPPLLKINDVQKGDGVSPTDARWIGSETYRVKAILYPHPAIGHLIDCYRKPRVSARNGGQTLVEFALIIPIFLLLMLGVVQMVVVGGAALAVNQAAISCTRYASLNPSFAQSSVGTYLTATASPLINDSGLQPIVLSPGAVPRVTGTAVSVTVTYNLQTKLFLGKTFFGVTFPSQLSVTQTMTSE